MTKITPTLEAAAAALGIPAELIDPASATSGQPKATASSAGTIAPRQQPDKAQPPTWASIEDPKLPWIRVQDTEADRDFGITRSALIETIARATMLPLGTFARIHALTDGDQVADMVLATDEEMIPAIERASDTDWYYIIVDPSNAWDILRRWLEWRKAYS